jgi:hypothetical protein
MPAERILLACLPVPNSNRLMLSQPQRLRRFAVYVLLVWLFGLGSGIVNACVVQLGFHNPAHAAAHGGDHRAAVLQAAQASQATGDEQDCDHTHPPCERLCDAPSVVPQAEKQQSNPLTGFLLAPAPIPSFNFQPRAEAGETIASAHWRWRKSIPISIAFLRLTL